MKKYLAISFYGSTESQLDAFKGDPRFEILSLRGDPKNLGTPISLRDFKSLEINYSLYDAVVTWGDALFPAIKEFLFNCKKNNLLVVSCQHGVNKSILQIAGRTPNKLTDYWLTEGQYMLDRFQEVVGLPASWWGWTTIGSIKHSHITKNYKWVGENIANGRILIIHEPDLRKAEGDPHPHDSEAIIDIIVKACKEMGLECDLKLHPNWASFMGNGGESLRAFEINGVNIGYKEMTNYSLVIGSRSSLIYESYLMGIPVIAIESESGWADDKIPYLEGGFIDKAKPNLDSILSAISNSVNRPKKIDQTFVEYLSGDLLSDPDRLDIFIREKIKRKTFPLEKTPDFILKTIFNIKMFSRIIFIKLVNIKRTYL